MTRRTAALIAAHLLYMGAAAPAHAMQILEAADHAELAAEISARDVNRIALSGDRIARVIRAPSGFAAEHDPASGDLYLRPVSSGSVSAAADATTAASWTSRPTWRWTPRATCTSSTGATCASRFSPRRAT